MMTRLVFSVVILMDVGICWAQVQIPPGFEVVQITDDPEDDIWARMNNCGEVVFSKGVQGDTSAEVFLYDNGAVTQITDDSVSDAFVDINDEGTIVWTRHADGFGGGEIVRLRDGMLTVLDQGSGPRINNLGHVVWTHWYGDGCGDARADIMFYDGTTIEQLTDDEFTKTSGWINENDDLVWTWYDFCVSPWESEIILWIDGVGMELASGLIQSQVPTMNDLQEVTWMGLEGIHIWADGVTSLLTDSGSVPIINNAGDILFQREEAGPRQIWWYRDGEFYQLTDDPIFKTARDINDYGEAVWWILEPGHWDLGMLRRVRNGDVDLDFDVDADDFASFPECMTGPVETDHLCDCRFFDIDRDRDVDMADYVMFQSAFTGGN